MGQSACSNEDPFFPFYHGVASGDATQNGVIIWTRVSPEQEKFSVDVSWFIALDEGMSQIVSNGVFNTNADRDFTVKVDVQNLQSNTWYYYSFEALGYASMVGRTKTLTNGEDEFSVAVFSCSNYENGYFNAYNDAAKNNLIQAVFHLGDYYYEYANGSALPDRIHQPDHVLYSLSDYRLRHAQTCTDRDVQELKRQVPWYVLWDDHEFSDDCWSGGAHGHNATIASWEQRKAASRKAYLEWMPIRENADGSIYKKFDVGNLAHLIFVDDRMQERSAPVAADSPAIDDSTRTILGEAQMNWLFQNLDTTHKFWNIVPSSLMKTSAVNALGQPIDNDLWEGYRFERNKLFNYLAENEIQNFVSLAGDYHASWASNLAIENYDELLETGSVGCEIATCAVTSFPHTVGDIATFQNLNPHVQFIEETHNGYLLCKISSQTFETQWIYLNSISDKNYFTIKGQTIRVEKGSSFLRLENENLTIAENDSELSETSNRVVETWETNTPKLAAALPFPNPANSELSIKWFSSCGQMHWQLFDLVGHQISSGLEPLVSSGLQCKTIDVTNVASGCYFLHVKVGNEDLLRQVCVNKE